MELKQIGIAYLLKSWTFMNENTWLKIFLVIIEGTWRLQKLTHKHWWSLLSTINQPKAERKENSCLHGSQTLFPRYDPGYWQYFASVCLMLAVLQLYLNGYFWMTLLLIWPLWIWVPTNGIFEGIVMVRCKLCCFF